jgi:mycothiol synthase
MIRVRSLNHEDDFLRMQNLIRENYTNSNWQMYPSPSDLDYWRYIYDESPDGVHGARLWYDDNGRILAFAWMNEDAVDFVCHYQYKELQNDIIEWSEEERLKNANEKIVNCLYIFDCDKEGEFIAESKGYRKSKIFNYYGKRDLQEPIPKAQLPFGYTIKSIETEEEIQKRAELNKLAGNEITADKYKYFMKHALNYRQELDLIAVAPNGDIAGFCTAWYDSICKVGMFEPYAVHFDHLRKGIGRSLLPEGMSRLLMLGCSAVYVTHAGLDSDEMDPALALNESVGFRKVANNYMWFKQIR